VHHQFRGKHCRSLNFARNQKCQKKVVTLFFNFRWTFFSYKNYTSKTDLARLFPLFENIPHSMQDDMGKVQQCQALSPGGEVTFMYIVQETFCSRYDFILFFYNKLLLVNMFVVNHDSVKK
jgi:hypothetical protein